MQTEKIQFSVDRMKDAIRYETRDGREVSQVTVFDCDGTSYPVRGVVTGTLEAFDDEGLHRERHGKKDLFIIIEKQIKYPCLCWVSDEVENPSKAEADMGYSQIDLIISKNKAFCGFEWSYSTPLTDDELAGFGLARVDNEK